MNKFNKLAIFATLALSAVACSQNDEPMVQSGNFPADGVIRVAANVNKPQTRAGMTTDNLSDFFMYVENPVETTGRYTYFVKMKKEGGVWKSYNPQGDSEIQQGLPASEKVMLWQNKMNTINITAFRVARNLVGSTWAGEKSISVRQDQSTAENVAASDILYMPQRAVNPSADLTSDGKIRVQFMHRLSKLNIKLNLATEFNLVPGGTTVNPIKKVIVSNFNNVAKWDPKTDAMRNEGDSHAFLVPCKVDYTAGEADTKQAVAKYECILLPQEIKNVSSNPDDMDFQFSVKIEIGGKTYLWSQPVGSALMFLPNTQYNLTLNVGKDAITLGGFSIIPWGDGGSSDIETE